MSVDACVFQRERERESERERGKGRERKMERKKEREKEKARQIYIEREKEKEKEKEKEGGAAAYVEANTSVTLGTPLESNFFRYSAGTYAIAAGNKGSQLQRQQQCLVVDL